METTDISCYHCHAKLTVKIGTSFYNATAWYTCPSCTKSGIVELTQTAFLWPNEDVPVAQLTKAENHDRH